MPSLGGAVVTRPDRLAQLFEDQPVRLTVQQVADLLGISKKAVYRWVGNGEIPAYQLGGSWIIFRDELLDQLRKNSNQAPTYEAPDDEAAAPEAPDEG